METEEPDEDLETSPPFSPTVVDRYGFGWGCRCIVV